MRYLVPILVAGAVLVVLLARRSSRGRAERDATKRTGMRPFEDHSHASGVHEHENSHVTQDAGHEHLGEAHIHHHDHSDRP